MIKSPKIKELLPNLNVKERMQLLLRNLYGKNNFLTNEESKMLSRPTTQNELSQFRYYFDLATNRNYLAFLLADAFHDFRHKASLLSWFYYQIYNRMPLQILERIVSMNDQILTEDELLVLDFMRKSNPIEIATDDIKETISFKEENHQILKGMKLVFSDDLERLISMREALRRIDLDLGNP